jgi:DNA-binding MarR family transcriptional regulator
MTVTDRVPLTEDLLRWVERVHVLEYIDQSVPRRTGAVAMALAMLDRDLPMSSREIARYARMGHETVRRGADALLELGLIDRHRRARLDTTQRR